MKMEKAVGGLTNLVLTDESGKADTLDGDWDEVRWRTVRSARSRAT
jgi:hypothetical protein